MGMILMGLGVVFSSLEGFFSSVLYLLPYVTSKARSSSPPVNHKVMAFVYH